MRDTFKALGTILHNRAFSVMLLCAGCVQACFMAYLATSSYIYTVEFGVPVQAYSVFFALSGCSSLIGPWFYMHILYDRFSQKNIYRACLIGILAGGLCIGLVGWLQYNGGLTSLGTLAPILFWLSFLLVAFNNSIGRPLATSMLLKQHDRDTGSLAALINFGLYIIGLIGMVIGSYDWPSYIIALGVIVLVLGFTALVLYSIVCRPSMNLRLEEDASSQPGQEA